MRQPEIQRDMRDAVLCWCATSAPDGTPNVSPKEIFAPHGEDGLVIADIASPVTVRNVRTGSSLCVSFINIFRQKGWKLEGPGQIIARSDAGFPDAVRDLVEMAGPDFPIRHVIRMRITRHTRIIAPGYRFRPDVPDEERIACAMRAYGVQARDRDRPGDA
ncbi:pyridoxamine 5'-phosphate oxidase family protein [Saliniramus sp.]|uniref:pyridoxamine 5'-phosphate oxidase family protein n=1 Tax=Saliniramus sp. TaxID=2986772 RepID=UPI002C46312F|nr:pyridoxamine 5'-phosphate oxidase family protein [Saliniramus sp.]HMB10560.1 pyridoxamine 5'-phosphate oxidase family protein [Saliniramus sp.]